MKILERGHIYFVYRPRVDRTSVRGPADIRRLYLVLHPRRKGLFRLIILGEKRLPDVTSQGDRRTWGFVEKVGKSPDDVEDELDPITYETKTRGERHVDAARPAGEGVYVIVRHDDHTHLAHRLEFPKRLGPVQRALNIAEEVSYIVSVKNPDAPSPPNMGLDETRRAKLPKKLRDRFRNRRFISVDPPEFLDYEGTELLSIGASKGVSQELGIEIAPEHEAESEAAVFRDLRLESSLHPVKLLFEGTWT